MIAWALALAAAAVGAIAALSSGWAWWWRPVAAVSALGLLLIAAAADVRGMSRRVRRVLIGLGVALLVCASVIPLVPR